MALKRRLRDAIKTVFGPKGRFRQPRPQAWEGYDPVIGRDPERVVHRRSPPMPQSLAKVYIHVIFSTKNRESLIAPTWRDELFHVMGGAANHLGCQSLLVGGVEDPVHMLFQLGRTISLADAISKIKSTASLWVNQTRGLDRPFHWQSGYAAFSVSQSHVDTVRDYIQRQPERHAKQSFQDELRDWLKKYEIEWDERYLWD
jgi:putative transposase